MNLRQKLLVACLATIAFPVALLADSAVYFCAETGSYGAAWGVSSDEAANTAYTSCEQQGGSACEELVACEGTGYGAIAVSNNQIIGASCGAGSQAEASKAATNSCKQSGGTGCAVKHTWNG